MASKPNLGVVIALVLSLLGLCGLAEGSAPNLIADWKFDEGSGTTATDSVGGNNGVIYGANWTDGLIGGALSFDGVDDYVDFGDIDEFEFGDANFTVAAWFYTQGPHSAYDGYGDVVGKYNYGGDGRQWVIYQDPNGRIDFYTNPTGQWATDEHLWSHDGYQGRWTHIVAVRDGSTKILYIDGASENTGATAGVVTGKSSKVYVGCRENPSGRGYFFNGIIDDVRVYNRALSVEEIKELYPEGGGPIAHWEFDEGSGTTAYDPVGTNHGTIYGATWTTGQIGGALSFDGVDDYVQVRDPVDDSLDFGANDSFSISAWIKYEGTVVVKRYSIVGKRNHDGNAWEEGYGLWVYNNKLFFHIEDTTGKSTEIFGSSIVADNGWHHVMACRDMVEGKLYVYVDGSSDATPVDDIATGSLSGNEPFTIGRAHGDNYFEGLIDDVRIYDRALSAEEIRQLYQNGSSSRGLPVSPRIAVDNIERAIRGKVEAWKKIDDMLKKEREAYDALEQMLRTGDYRSSSYSDIVRARYEIYSAIEQGERSKEALERSIENLEAALAALGFELVPKASAWLGQAKLAVR